MKEKKLMYRILSFFKYVLILWIPILLVEETFIFDYIGTVGSLVCSLLTSVLCFGVYIRTYKRLNKNIRNCYIYNISNAIFLAIINTALGYLFIKLIDLNLLHQCNENGWYCFLFGVEYILIGFEYAILPIIILIVWLIIKLIKLVVMKNKEVKQLKDNL